MNKRDPLLLLTVMILIHQVKDPVTDFRWRRADVTLLEFDFMKNLSEKPEELS